MGRAAPLPEDADSWGEFQARLEMEAASWGGPLTWLWWALGGALFAVAMIASAYAFQGGRWWLWLVMLASLAATVVLAGRALRHADRTRAREVELNRLHEAWIEHLDRVSRKP